MTAHSSLILLVEDDPNDVFFFQRAVEKARITNPLQVVRDGQEAIEYLSGDGEFNDRAKFPLPKLIVLDLNLPRQHGLQVLAWLRANRSLRLIPVTVLTSSESRVDIEQAYSLGANSYLVKPGGPDELVELVKLISAYWLGANLPPP